ncbi:hypothetical protein V6N13_144543 [Hibiscus sabdariffa]|uniref:HMA domain-containing protein n=2 Tax=Hibiscus sabdariffa TaxID=183260 RepID=A0ABR2FKN8_9ROSI
MKGMDIFCASQASKDIRSGVDRRRIDRQNSKPYAACNSSQLPIIPRPKPSDVRRKSSADIHDLKSSPGSSTRLLSDTPFADWLPESDRVSALLHSQPAKPKLHVRLSSNNNSSPALKSFSSARSHPQVVVLRVSIHCKGCEGKLRKHISKMEGVTSFSIDLQKKKVTVIGDVTPSSVLASVSRVKTAQLWPATPPSQSSPMVKMNY